MAAGFLFGTMGGINWAECYLAAGRIRNELKQAQLVGLIYALAVAVVMLIVPQLARAGGPRYVAGVSYFAAGTKGVPLTWAQGAVNYYTDQGNLSPILPGPTADAFVASAFSQWTSIPTAAIAAT